MTFRFSYTWIIMIGIYGEDGTNLYGQDYTIRK